MKGDIPEDYADTLEKAIKDKVCSTPHMYESVPDFSDIKHENMKTLTQNIIGKSHFKKLVF